MSMLGIVQNFIGLVANSVNEKDNPLGLSAGQIDEINQILTLIKNLISDGIQRNDITKLVTLMGEMAEAMPEMSAEIKEIIDGLKQVAKKLFEDPEAALLGKQSPSETRLGMESQLSASSSETDPNLNLGSDSGATTSDAIADPVDGLMSNLILDETTEKRFEIAEKILNLVNDNMVLSQANFNALTQGLQAIKNRASISDNVVDDNVIQGVTDTSSLS